MSRWHGCALLPPSADAPSAQKVPKGKKDKEGLQCFYHRQSQHHFRRRHLLFGMARRNSKCCHCLIGKGREFFEDTLEVVPVKHADRWEGD
jgi:hypothetical protein